MSLSSTLPAWIGSALARELSGMSRRAMAERAGRISNGYRVGENSSRISDLLDVLAYASVRMPATFAASRAALAHSAALVPDFLPNNLLDVGAGPGTATWAALDVWPSIQSAVLLDENNALLDLARRLSGSDVLGQCRFGFEATSMLPGIRIEESPDLILASYSLTELPATAASAVLADLWRHTGKMLVIVEPGTSAGFTRLLSYRKELIAAGACILAPCTHDGVCPLEVGGRWCHFSERLQRSREHQQIKEVDLSYEDEKFSYLTAFKSAARSDSLRRVLSTPVVNKFKVSVTLCAPEHVEERVYLHRNPKEYKAAKRLKWGDSILQ